MYYGTQLGPMWGIERIVAAGIGMRRRRRAALWALGALLISSLMVTPGAAANPHPPHPCEGAPCPVGVPSPAH